MANTLSKSGIVLGHEVDAWHVTQSIDAFTKVSAYDITVSGSFTLTGSLKVSGSVLGRTTGTASYAVTSSYTNYTPTVISASKAQYNLSNGYSLQFYAPTISGMLSSTSYYIGAGEIIGSNNCGITIPVDSIITLASVVSTCETQSLWANNIIIYNSVGSIYAFTNPVLYKDPFNYFLEDIGGLPVSKGERIFFRLVTDPSPGFPKIVSHNITLFLYPT
jgi:hypothetical protein